MIAAGGSLLFAIVGIGTGRKAESGEINIVSDLETQTL